jgi:hypothetical protein
LFGQIIVNDESMLSTISEEFSHCRRCKWGDILQGGGLGSSGGDDDAVFHGILLLKSLDELGNGGSLLSDGHVDTVELLGLVVAVVPSLLVQHSVEGDGCLSGLTIANDQLTLATTDGHHGVDGLETSLHGLVHRSSRKNAGSLQLGTASLGGVERALAIDGVTEGIDYTTKQFSANRHVDLRMIVNGKGLSRNKE